MRQLSGHGDALESSVLALDVDRAPLREPRHDQSRQLAESRLVIEGAVEHECRFQKKRVRPIGTPPLVFQTLAVADVTSEAARVLELAVLEQRARAYLDVADRSVPGDETSLALADFFIRAQAAKDVVDDFSVDMEFGDLVPDVFVARIAEQRQLGGIGPEDRAVPSHPMQADRGVLHEVLQVALALPERFLGLATRGQRLPQRHLQFLPVLDLGRQRAGALPKESDLARASIVVA